MKRNRPVCLVLLLCALGWILEAQRVKSTLSGVVVDPSGAAVAGAKVTLTSSLTGIAKRFSTLQDGTYAFPLLDPGSYSITTTVTGFKTAAGSISALLNPNRSIQFALKFLF